jgi:hypothetical protein
MPSKLNLGCGLRHLTGWCNVDRFAGCEPDLVHDLEHTPWPFADDSVEEMRLHHVLEHLGHEPRTFLAVMQELWRVARHGARIEIHVPHPLHRDYRTDPTHVRPITPELLAMFSRTQCEIWQASGAANTPLAILCGVDFEIEACSYLADPDTQALLAAKGIDIPVEDVIAYGDIVANLIKEIQITLRVCKRPADRAATQA